MRTGSISTIQIVADDPAMRHSLTLIIDVLGQRMVEHAGAATVLEEPGRLKGCSVADLRMPNIDGLTMLTRLRAAGSMVPVEIMADDEDIPTAVRAMKLGACDFLEKPFTAPLMLVAVRAALAVGGGGPPANDDDAAFAQRVNSLTGRERDVLHLVLLGCTNKEIGQALNISRRTVGTYRAKVMTKNGCECAQILTRRAVRTTMH